MWGKIKLGGNTRESETKWKQEMKSEIERKINNEKAYGWKGVKGKMGKSENKGIGENNQFPPETSLREVEKEGKIKKEWSEKMERVRKSLQWNGREMKGMWEGRRWMNIWNRKERRVLCFFVLYVLKVLEPKSSLTFSLTTFSLFLFLPPCGKLKLKLKLKLYLYTPFNAHTTWNGIFHVLLLCPSFFVYLGRWHGVFGLGLFLTSYGLGLRIGFFYLIRLFFTSKI